MLTCEVAYRIANGILEEGRKRSYAPLCAAVLDPGGHLVALLRDDKASIHRPQIAIGKASGCIGLGVGGRTLAAMASDRPTFVASLSGICTGGCVPAPGGVLIRNGQGELIGAVGVTGDLSANDEACALAVIEREGLVADAGQ